MTTSSEVRPSIDDIDSLCQAINHALLLWFNAHLELYKEMRINSEWGRIYQFPHCCIGDTECDATFEVFTLEEVNSSCSLNMMMTFNEKIEWDRDMVEVYKVINHYNAEKPSRCVYYDEKQDKIIVEQTEHFWPGSEINQKYIYSLLDSFFDEDLTALNEIIEAGGFFMPEEYDKNYFGPQPPKIDPTDGPF